MHDWDGDGKQTPADDYIEYNIYKEVMGDDKNSGSGGGGGGCSGQSCLVALICLIIVFAPIYLLTQCSM